MSDSYTIVALGGILGVGAVAIVIYAMRFRERRRAEKLRRRGYKEYNRGRAKLVIDPAQRVGTREPMGS